jgi:hypothetical protein
VRTNTKAVKNENGQEVKGPDCNYIYSDGNGRLCFLKDKDDQPLIDYILQLEERIKALENLK